MIIFATKNKNNGKIFVGYSLNDTADSLGTGKYITKAIRVHGADAFEKTVLEKFEQNVDLQDFLERVEYWIAKYKSDNPDFGYNETRTEMQPSKKKLTTKIQVLLSQEDNERLNDYIIKKSMERGTELTVSYFVRELILKEINKKL